MTRVLLGLTGSIGMGKSTTAQMFRDMGCDMWDADAAVHRLYEPGGAAVAPIGAAHPAAVENGRVNRENLKKWIASDQTALSKIETIVHPLVQNDRNNFKNHAKSDILVFDIPLLFETGSQAEFDHVVVVHTDVQTQEHRVLERGGMTQDHFNLILSKQMPSDQKCAMADFVVNTTTLDGARQKVAEIVNGLRAQNA